MKPGNSVQHAGWRAALWLGTWTLTAVLVVAAAGPAKADLGDFIRDLFGGEATPEAPSEAPAGTTAAPGPTDAAALPCPQNMVEYTGLSENCGTDRPPAPHGRNDGLTGLWDVEASGNPFHETATVALNRGYAGVGHRDPQAQNLVAAGVARDKDKNHFRTINPTARETEDGSLYIHLVTSGYCGCVPYTVTVKPTGDPNVMIGEWAFDYNKAKVKKGTAILRRRPAGQFGAASLNWTPAGPAQGFARDEVPFGTRPLRIELRHPVTCGYGGARANCGGTRLAVWGTNLAGGHDAWIDPASHIELRKAGWICANGDFRDFGAGWTRCGSGRDGGDGVVGLGFHLLFRDGMTPGARTLWIDGHPIHLEVALEGFPEDEKPAEPALVLLDARDAADKLIAEVREGEPFQVKAIFEASHPQSWVSVAVPSLAPQATVVLRRTDDPKVFQSEWLAVEAGPAAR